VGLNPPSFRRRLSSNPNSVTSEEEPSGLLAYSSVVNLVVAYQFTISSSFCPADPRDWHTHCAHGEVGAQCTGEMPSLILLASGSFCFQLLQMLCTPRAWAGRGTQSTYLVKSCSLQEAATGHSLVTFSNPRLKSQQSNRLPFLFREIKL